jgi:hypothetical protein
VTLALKEILPFLANLEATGQDGGAKKMHPFFKVNSLVSVVLSNCCHGDEFISCSPVPLTHYVFNIAENSVALIGLQTGNLWVLQAARMESQ